MILCYRINQTANVGDFEVTVANFAQRSEWNQLTSRIASIKGVNATVEAIRKNDEAVRNCVCSSAIFMDTGADVRQTDTINERKNFGDLPHRIRAQKSISTVIAGVTFNPVGIGFVDANL